MSPAPTPPNYHCPLCGTLSTMALCDTQAFCTNTDGCNVLTFNPSLPDGGLSGMQVIDGTAWEKPE